MAYQNHFRLADDMITHLNTVMGGIVDPFISSRYVGFVAVAAVTVYELAIKEIFIEFGEKKHKCLGSFTQSYFDRINGRIKIKNIKEDYISRFGDKYVKRFKKKLDVKEKTSLQNHRISIVNSYTNVIIWRHSFAHEGKIPTTVTYNEIVKSYESGKEVLDCLSDTMQR